MFTFGRGEKRKKESKGISKEGIWRTPPWPPGCRGDGGSVEAIAATTLHRGPLRASVQRGGPEDTPHRVAGPAHRPLNSHAEEVQAVQARIMGLANAARASGRARNEERTLRQRAGDRALWDTCVGSGGTALPLAAGGDGHPLEHAIANASQHVQSDAPASESGMEDPAQPATVVFTEAERADAAAARLALLRSEERKRLRRVGGHEWKPSGSEPAPGMQQNQNDQASVLRIDASACNATVHAESWHAGLSQRRSTSQQALAHLDSAAHAASFSPGRSSTNASLANQAPTFATTMLGTMISS